MEEDLLDLNDQPINNGDNIEPSEDYLPDPDQVASEWGNLEEVISEESIDDNEDPFATMPINIADENENFTLEDLIAQILDFNDPLITTPMDNFTFTHIEESGIQIVAISGNFQDGPDPPPDQLSDEE